MSTNAQQQTNPCLNIHINKNVLSNRRPALNRQRHYVNVCGCSNVAIRRRQTTPTFVKQMRNHACLLSTQTQTSSSQIYITPQTPRNCSHVQHHCSDVSDNAANALLPQVDTTWTLTMTINPSHFQSNPICIRGPISALNHPHERDILRLYIISKYLNRNIVCDNL